MRSLCSVSMRDSLCEYETKAVGTRHVCVSDDFIRSAFIYDQYCTSSSMSVLCLCVCFSC